MLNFLEIFQHFRHQTMGKPRIVATAVGNGLKTSHLTIRIAGEKKKAR